MTEDFVIDQSHKSFPFAAAPLLASEMARRGWNLFDLPFALPLAVIHRSALEHNLGWMQEFARAKGVCLAPHGKTTMSPEIFRMQLNHGAWGLSFATLFQARVGVKAGAEQIIIANQVIAPTDFANIDQLLADYPRLKIYFLVDSLEQLSQLNQWRQNHPAAAQERWGLLVELGVAGKRSGCRTVAAALQLARRIAGTAGLRLCGIEVYEGVVVTGASVSDQPAVATLMAEVTSLVQQCDREGLFAEPEILLTAGGSAVFDLVIPALAQQSPANRGLSRPVRGVLRSGCYVIHDHGHYHRLLEQLEAREGLSDSLRPALTVWTMVQSVPEPGLALLTCGRRDISYDLELPIPQAIIRRGSRSKNPLPVEWRMTALNDQHGFLNYPPEPVSEFGPPQVGDVVILGISHPCTTFDKWRWLVLAEDDGTVCGAIRTVF
ncbi:MAG: amino acid deaminase [Alphaproteobacteria bacterium]|nr:amino acid deaminase [Alphaproteobacteria bacterium]